MGFPISIVLPAYNAAATIERAIRSVLASTFANFELLVVDDGSSDGTADVVAAISDSRIRLIRQEHAGIVAACNRGVAEARAALISRMDADDFCHPERFDRQLGLLQNQDLDAVGGRVRIVDGSGAAVPTLKRYEDWVNDHMTPEAIAAWRFVESPLVHPTVTARREVFELGYRAGDFPEDYDLWLRAVQQGFRFAKVPEIVLDWTDGPGRLTRTDAAYTDTAFDRCRREHLRAGPLRSVTQVDLWGAGATGKPWLRWVQRQGISVRHLVEVSPRKIGEQIHGVRVEGPDAVPHADGTPLLVAVGAPGAHEQILARITTLGYEPGRNTWFVA